LDIQYSELVTNTPLHPCLPVGREFGFEKKSKIQNSLKFLKIHHPVKPLEQFMVMGNSQQCCIVVFCLLEEQVQYA
jgi:hypothetical protein